MESVHGHEVLNMMIASGKTWTRESLIAEIHQKFGNDVRFHTCSSDDMTAGELIDFLEARGKFVARGDGFASDERHVCHH
ncbi:MAG: YecH family protein [Proteobacteria bacterium]|nr:YecH family protein [Pseudomonadota bacterium]MCL2306878.1 YecH family protein [Pseudomonadota bacterium]